MDKKRVVLIWLIMASVIAVIAYLFGAAWWLAAIIGVVAVAAIVAGATGTLYLRQKRLLESAGKARKDALYIASQAMNCSVQEAEKRLSERMTKQAANQEMAKHQPKRRGRPR